MLNLWPQSTQKCHHQLKCTELVFRTEVMGVTWLHVSFSDHLIRPSDLHEEAWKDMLKAAISSPVAAMLLLLRGKTLVSITCFIFSSVLFVLDHTIIFSAMTPPAPERLFRSPGFLTLTARLLHWSLSLLLLSGTQSATKTKLSVKG